MDENGLVAIISLRGCSTSHSTCIFYEGFVQFAFRWELSKLLKLLWMLSIPLRTHLTPLHCFTFSHSNCTRPAFVYVCRHLRPEPLFMIFFIEKLNLTYDCKYAHVRFAPYSNHKPTLLSTLINSPALRKSHFKCFFAVFIVNSTLKILEPYLNRFSASSCQRRFETVFSGLSIKYYFRFRELFFILIMHESRFGKLIGVLDVSNSCCKFLVSSSREFLRDFKVKSAFVYIFNQTV